jgi:hypothetical protein
MTKERKTLIENFHLETYCCVNANDRHIVWYVRLARVYPLDSAVIYPETANAHNF